MQKRRIILISVVLLALTGVVMTEGEQEVDKLKATNNEPNNLELVEEDTLTVSRNKRRNNQGDNEDHCSTVVRGCDGRDGQPGPQGPKGDSGSSGATYVRWGRTVCPTGAERIYYGKTTGSKYNLGGGTDQTLCLPNDPEYFPGDTLNTNAAFGTLWGTRVEVYTSTGSVPLNKRAGLQMPCVVCFVSNKSTILTIPAKYTCPTGWTLEYNGYLMSEHTLATRRPKDTICADRIGESAGSYTPHPAIQLLMNVHCDEGLVCPPYTASKPLTCAVCSK